MDVVNEFHLSPGIARFGLIKQGGRIMKRFVFGAVLAACLAAMPALGAVPQIISYQGVLTDNAGNVVTTTPHAFTFNIYDVPTGGAPLWTETQPSLPVKFGGFSADLGSVTALALPFDKPYYLGIAVDGGVEMSPRTPLDASPYSLTSKSLEDGATGAPPIKMITLTGTTASTDGGTVFIPMPISADKLLSVSVLVNYTSTGMLPPNYTKDPCFEFQYYVFGGYLYVNNIPGNSSCVTSAPFKALVVYEP